MHKLLCYLLMLPIILASDERHTFKGQCPKFVPLAAALISKRSFTGAWFQYAVHPNYLQDKCIKRVFNSNSFWPQFAQTDNENFIIQYFCYEHRIRRLGRHHSRSISIFVREREATPSTVAALTNALRHNYKFPVSLLNYTDYSYCTDVEIKQAVARA